MSTIFLTQFPVHYSSTPLHIHDSLLMPVSLPRSFIFFFPLPNILLWIAEVCMRARLPVALPVPFPRVIVCLRPGLSAGVSLAVLQPPARRPQRPRHVHGRLSDLGFTSAARLPASRSTSSLCPPPPSVTFLPIPHLLPFSFPFVSPKLCLSPPRLVSSNLSLPPLTFLDFLFFILFFFSYKVYDPCL